MGEDKRRRSPSHSPPPRGGRSTGYGEDGRGGGRSSGRYDGSERDRERDYGADRDRDRGRERDWDRDRDTGRDRGGREREAGRDRGRSGGYGDPQERGRPEGPDPDRDRGGWGGGGRREQDDDRAAVRSGEPGGSRGGQGRPGGGGGGRGAKRERDGDDWGGGGGGGGGGRGGRDGEASKYMSREEREAKQREAEEAAKLKAPKEQPNLGLSGKLAAETNKTATGVELKHVPPPEARRPDKRWRLYIFKNDQLQDEPYRIHRMDHYLFGRDVSVADIVTAHPSCSKQHAVLQFRLTDKEDDTGLRVSAVRPYLLDLGSVNGTFLNGERLEALRYYELLEKDVMRFGQSTREYVLLHDNSGDGE